MAQYRTYESKDTIKARQVTSKEGEDVVTRNGGFHVPYGDYIVDRDGRVDSVEKAEFEAHFKVPTRRATKKTAAKKTTRKRGK